MWHGSLGIVYVSSKTITLKMLFPVVIFPVYCCHCPFWQEISFSPSWSFPTEISRNTGGLLRHLFSLQMPRGGKLESTISPQLPLLLPLQSALLLKAGPIDVYLLEMLVDVYLLGDSKIELHIYICIHSLSYSQIRATVVWCLGQLRDFSPSPFLC